MTACGAASGAALAAPTETLSVSVTVAAVMPLL